MPAQIRPNRLDVTDRFPMLGFTIRSSEATRAEVALATDPALFAAEARGQRTPGNFYSSRAQGDLTMPRGEAVWIVPADVMARFVGSGRLYFALATANNGSGPFTVATRPTADSPYVSLAGLTGRSLRQVRVLRNTRRDPGLADLAWAGDSALPGQMPVAAPAPAPANGGAGAAPPPAAYDDGFGPMPDQPAPPTPQPAPDPVAGAPAPVAGAAQAVTLGLQRRAPVALALSAERTPVSPPGVTSLSGLTHAAAETALLAVPPPLGTLILALRAAARLSAAAGAPVSIGLGPAVGGGLGAGATLGTGLIFGPNSELGVYGAAQFNVGFILSISATCQITVVKGGIESFSGWSTAMVVSGGEGIVGGAAALFDANGNFQGVSVEAGIGAGFSPVDFYVAVQRQVATQLGMAAALGQVARALIIGPEDMIRAQTHAPHWRELYNFVPPADVVASIESRGFRVQWMRDAAGSLNLDEYKVAIEQLPTGWDGPRLLQHFQQNINQFLDTGNTEFIPYDGHDAGKIAGGDPVGAVWFLDIVGPDNAAVVISENTPAHFRVTTIHTPRSGDHPVTGNREFGWREENGQLVFYTKGADRSTHGFPEFAVFGGADALWRSFQQKTVEWVRSNGGAAHAIAPFSERFHPEVVRILYGTAQGLAAIPRTARPFSTDIPLDPGVGGMSIGYDALQVGDIILSTGDAAVSRLIRFGTSGQVSHAMLYVGQGGQVIEAVGDGVVLRPLDRAIADATVAVAFRVPDLTDVERQQVADAAAGLIGLPYNYVGIARQAAFQVDNRLCQALPNGLSDRCRAFVGRIDLGTADNQSFFCSQAVLEAFSRAGHPLTTEPPHWASPQDLAELRLNYAKLRYVGHLKAAPSGGLFGHLFAHAEGAPPVRARALSGGYSLNWDDVQLVPQRYDRSCWAASLSMLIGWRDQVSIDEGSIAAACGRAPNQRGPIQRADVLAVIDALGLFHEEPQSFSEEGFRQLLEANGPVWVCKQAAEGVASGHAVVVVGIYSDGTDTYLRIADPWDRVIGTPGAPGPHLSTHATGSRYIQRYADFMREYQWQQRLMNDRPAHQQYDMLQLIHSGGTGGRTPSTGTPPAGYAQGLARAGARTLARVQPDYAPTDAVGALRNLWDYISRYAQWDAGVPNARFMPHSAICQIRATKPGRTEVGTGFYAGPGLIVTAAHVLAGATGARVHRGRANDDVLHMFDIEPEHWTLHPHFRATADAYDLAVIRAQVFPVAEGDYFELQDLGDSVWRKVIVSGYAGEGVDVDRQHMDGTTVHEMSVDGHHIVYNLHTTGGTSGSPVICLVGTGAEAEWSAAARIIGVHVDAHSPTRNIAVRLTSEKISWILNRGMVAPAPLPAPLALRHTPPAPSRGHARGLEAPPLVIRRTEESERHGVHFSLEQMDGMRAPATQAAVQMAPLPADLVIEDWPRMPDANGATRGGVRIAWHHAAGAVGDIRVTPTTAGVADGWKLDITGRILDGPDTETSAGVTVEISYTFNRPGETTERATVRVVLTGDGRHTRTNEWALEPQAIGN